VVVRHVGVYGMAGVSIWSALNLLRQETWELGVHDRAWHANLIQGCLSHLGG
jgi:hypothetical protein